MNKTKLDDNLNKLDNKLEIKAFKSFTDVSLKVRRHVWNCAGYQVKEFSVINLNSLIWNKIRTYE